MTSTDTEHGPPPTAPGARWRSIVGFALGLTLLLAAVWAVASQDMGATWSAAARRPHGLLVVALLSLVNWALMSATFSTLMKPFGRVGRGEMAALIAASWLLNYLPMRPGLVGRVAYHKVVNGIAVRHSLFTIAGNVGCGFVSMGLGAAVAAVSRPEWLGPLNGAGPRGIIVFAPAAVLAVGGALAARRPVLRSWFWASLLRYGDLLVWAIRYGAVFWVVGRDLDLSGALAIAVVSQAVSLVPMAGNGLGLREWAVGLTAGALPVWMAGPGLEHEVGLAADLVNRAAEVLAAVPAGLASTYWLAKRRKSALSPVAHPQPDGVKAGTV